MIARQGAVPQPDTPRAAGKGKQGKGDDDGGVVVLQLVTFGGDGSGIQWVTRGTMSVESNPSRN